METYLFSPIGWSKWLFGPILLIAGIGLAITFFGQTQHRIANNNGPKQVGQTFFCPYGRCNSTEVAINAALWSLFVLATITFILSGAAILESDRHSWIENHTWHTTRGVIPLFAKNYTKQDVRSFFVEKEPIIIVIGHVTSTSGWRYHVKALLTDEKRVVRITSFPNEIEAQKLVDHFKSEIGTTP